MEEKARRLVQVNLLPPMFKIIGQIKEDTGTSMGKIVEHFVRLGMNAAGYGPKEHRSTEQSADSNTNTKTDIEAFFRGLSPEKLREFADLLKDMADSR